MECKNQLYSQAPVSLGGMKMLPLESIFERELYRGDVERLLAMESRVTADMGFIRALQREAGLNPGHSSDSRDTWSFYYDRATAMTLRGDHRSALEDLELALSQTIDSFGRSRVALLKTEIFLMMGCEVDKVANLLANLETLIDEDDVIGMIRKKLCLARRYQCDPSSRILALKYAEKALVQALEHGLHELVKITLSIIDEEREFSVELPRSSLRESLWKTAQIQAKIELRLDPKYCALRYGDQCIALSHSPRLYKLIDAALKGIYRHDVAKILWPNERYLPRTHDARIFDLAKRARKILRQISEGELDLQSVDGKYFIDRSLGPLDAPWPQISQ